MLASRVKSWLLYCSWQLHVGLSRNANSPLVTALVLRVSDTRNVLFTLAPWCQQQLLTCVWQIAIYRLNRICFFLTKILYEWRCAPNLYSMYFDFFATTAELNSCNRNSMAFKAWSIYNFALYWKCLLTFGADHIR